MENNQIEEFRPSDIEAVVELWRVNFPEHDLSAESLRSYTFNHPGFDSKGSRVARSEGRVVGFMMATTMAIPELGPEELPGCLAVVMVHPDYRKRGIGGRLLAAGETYLKQQGKSRIRVGYPTYLRSTVLSFLGVDTSWKEAIWFFRHYGYRVTGLIDSATVPLADFKIPDDILEVEKVAAAKGIVTTVLTPRDEDVFYDFLKTTFPHWYEVFAPRRPLPAVDRNHVLLLKQHDRIIGFVGPFAIPASGVAALGIGIGVDSAFRGQGLGNLILYKALEAIKRQGGRECYLFGVGPKRYYENAGFHLAEMWLFMEKSV